MNKNVLKKIKEWEYLYNTPRKRMPYINSMKGNTLNKLKEGDARKQLKEGGCPQHTKGIGCPL